MSATDIFRFFRRVHLSTGEKARIRQLLRPNGTTLMLPYDQFIEHDCRHLEADSDAGNPDYLCELGIDGGYNAMVFHYGITHRYWSKVEGRIPMVLKINGKTSIPSEAQALSVMTGSVEDAVRIGALGVGYTMYYGSPRQDVDIPQLMNVRRECERYGMPLITWAYPRGEAIEAKGGRDSSYALESAARMAAEMGSTIIKSNIPKDAKPDYLENTKIPEYYRKVEKELMGISDPVKRSAERARRVVTAAQGVPILFSGGEKGTDQFILEHAQEAINAGCFGFIFGRNMWKREKKNALEITRKLQGLLDSAK